MLPYLGSNSDSAPRMTRKFPVEGGIRWKRGVHRSLYLLYTAVVLEFPLLAPAGPAGPSPADCVAAVVDGWYWTDRGLPLAIY